LIDKNPYNHLAWYNLGLSYSCNWEYDKAIDALEYSFIIEPGFESGYLECAEMCLQQNKIEKALEIFLDAKEKFGADCDLYVNIASCLVKLNRFEDAQLLLMSALKYDSYNDELYFMLAKCYESAESWYSAIDTYIKAIELDECREEYYLGLAKSYVKVEDYHKAIFNFHKATQICQEESTYWAEYVCFLLKLGLYKEALQILDEAEDYTYGADLLYCRAITNFFLKNKKEGLNVLAEALEDDFEKHTLIFELAPELEVDRDISSMLKYYAAEFS
jgi:tetratricopeptide (TPR) repeat protein